MKTTKKTSKKPATKKVKNNSQKFTCRLDHQTGTMLMEIMGFENIKTMNGAIIKAVQSHAYYRNTLVEMNKELEKFKHKSSEMIETVGDFLQAQKRLNELKLK